MIIKSDKKGEKGQSVTSSYFIKWAIAIFVALVVFLFYDDIYNMLVGAGQRIVDWIKLGR